MGNWGSMLFSAVSLNEEIHITRERGSHPECQDEGHHGISFQGVVSNLLIFRKPFFSPTDGGQEKSDHEVDHSQWAPAGGTRSSLSIPKLSIQFGHRLLFDFEVWRERCFILITVKGFNFFEVPLTRLTKPLNPYSLQPSFNARVPGLPPMQ